MIKPFSKIALSVLLLGALSCDATTSKYGLNTNLTSKSVNSEHQNINSVRSVEDVNLLCNKLSELKRMPYKDDIAGDPIYDGLKEKGKEAIPCLVEKITDVTVMDDPREAPHIEDFRVGDAAVFMLHEITKESLKNILPDKFVKLMETEGVYAYFAYVEKPKNRKKIQRWWKDWMKRTSLNQ